MRYGLLGTTALACGLGSLLAAPACATDPGGAASPSDGGMTNVHPPVNTGGTQSEFAGNGGAGPGHAAAGASGTLGTGGTSSSGGAPANGGTSGMLGASALGGATAAAGRGAGGSTSTGGRRAAAGGTGVSGATSTSGSAGMSAAGRSAAGGSSGSAGGTPVCGTAAEDASTTLTCPDGQIIQAITFASFGTPTGSCGSFMASDCNAASSVSSIEALCAGRSTCTITASNGSFGDPCHGTTKHLDVEASCVVGDPLPTTNSPYKGVANSPAAQLSALGSTWCYNWGTAPKSTDCNDPSFVPMIWGSDNVAGALQGIAKAGYKTVLGFNEPNKSDQSNIAVADAIALWPQLTSNADIRVGSPAVSDDGRAWLEDFMKQVKSKGLRVDFIDMHWYGWNAGSCTASQFEGAVNWASQWGLPVWVTEWGCMGSSNPDEQTVLDFYKSAITMLAKHPLVERYAWYPWNTYNKLYDDGGKMTALGQAFAAAPQYRP